MRPARRSAVAGAWLCPELDPGCSETRHVRRTDEQGRFFINSVTEPLVLSVSDPDSGRRFYYREGADGNLSWTAENLTVFLPEDGHWRSIRVMLPGAIPVTGTVLRWDGRPDSGVVVKICSQTEVGVCVTLVTDETGTYRHELYRDDYQLHFEGGGLSGSYRSGVSGNYTPLSGQATILRVRDGSATSLTLNRPRPSEDRFEPIAVRLLYDDGRPANVDASIRFCDGDCVVAQRLPDHRFVEQVEAGRHTVSVWLGEERVGYYDVDSPGNFSAGGVSHTVVSSPVHATSPLEIVLPSRTPVRGKLVNSRGEPVGGANVTLCAVSPPVTCAGNRTDEMGDFFGAHPHGDYYIAIWPPDGSHGFYAEGRPGNFTRDRSEASTIVLNVVPPEVMHISLPKAGLLRLRLLEPDSRPVIEGFPAFRLCRFEMEQICFWSVPSGALGVLEARVPDGDYFIEIARRGYVSGTGYFRWFVDQRSSNLLTTNPARRSRFPSDFNHSDPWTIMLPEIPRTSRIEILLQPGVNLIGASEGGVPLRELFAQSDRLVGMILLDRDGRPTLTVARSELRRLEHEVMLGEGQIAWLYVSGERPIKIAWQASRRGDHARPHVVQVNGGYVVWRSAEPTSLANAVRGLGPLESDPIIASTQEGGFGFRSSGTVQQGHVIWVNSPVEQVPYLRSDFEPNIVYIGRDDESLRREFSASFESVRQFFLDTYGLMLSQIDVEVYAGSETPEYLQVRCGLTGQTIRISCLDERNVARQYARALQYWLSSGLSEPGWLIAGAMDYAAALYEQAASGEAGDPIASYRTAPQGNLRDLRIDYWESSEIVTRRSVNVLGVDWLVQHAGGFDAIWDYFRRARAKEISGGNDLFRWPVAFEAAFGLTVESFHAEFAEYQKDGFE